MVQLPSNLGEVSAAWLTEALSIKFPGVVVEGFDELRVIHGAATKFQLRLKYRPRTQGRLPDTMWLKVGFEPHSGYIEELDFYRHEALFYGKVRSQYNVLAPESFFEGIQTQPRQVALLLEDLTQRQARFGLATRPYTVVETAAGLRTLAALHAATWNNERIFEEIGLRKVLTWGMRVHLGNYVEPDNARALFDTPRGHSIPAALHDVERLKAAFAIYCESAQRKPHCVLHGDTHMGNTFVLPDGRVGFLDWQTLTYGHWSHDVSYFIVTALATPERRAAERDLINGYVEALREFGVDNPPGHEAAWQDYRSAIYYAFLVFLGNGDEYQLPEINHACFARAGAAMIDHDVYHLLHV